MPLNKNFYQNNTLKVAQNLLGCFLVRKNGKKTTKGMITETEAYIGEDDLASHASRGRTKRTEIMYGKAGQAYIYIIYGMYHCLNIVTEKKDFPAAVLIRSIKIDDVEYKKTNGPGKLCKFLEIDRELNNWNMSKGEKLWVEKGVKIKKSEIHKDKRIGIDYAKHCKHHQWRFYIKLEK